MSGNLTKCRGEGNLVSENSPLLISSLGLRRCFVVRFVILFERFFLLPNPKLF